MLEEGDYTRLNKKAGVVFAAYKEVMRMIVRFKNA